MKTLTIGSTTLELNSFDKKWDKIGGVYALINIPVTAISGDDLEALLDGNAEDLIVTKEDGSTETFSGYSELHHIDKDIPNGVYVVTQYCTSTAMHLLNEARKEIATLQKEKTELENKVNSQAEALDNHAKIIVNQVDTITTLETQNKELNETVNALLGLEG